jgi:DNA end-binding protein Ku
MLRSRMHICALKVHNGILLLNQMRYHDELREAPEVPETKSEKVSPKELQLAVKLVEQLTEPFNAEAFKDTYLDALKKVIKAKAAGKEIHIAEPKKATATVKDLMDVLKQSLEEKQAPKKKRA